jgi:hypothetical protein
MPCLNEAQTLEGCIRTAQKAIRALGIAGEVIVADNGSTDDSISIAERCGARVVHVKRRGYGSALLGGIQGAQGTFVLMGDADASYDFGALPTFVAKLREGYDLVMGNRFAGGILPGAMPPLHRYLGNPVLTGIGRLFFHAPCRDFHCGLRAFRRDAILRMDLRTTGMEFASEMVVKATLHGLRIAEVPTTLSPDGRDHPPHLRSWRDGWRHLRFLLMYSPRWLFLYPGTILMLICGALTAWLLTGPKQVGPVVLDVHTLVYAASGVAIGFQAVAFAVFSKVFSITTGMVPPDPRLNRLFRVVTLEKGLLVGATAFTAGVAGTVYALLRWRGAEFGGLDYQTMLRIVVPSSLALMLGLQIVLSSFFLSLLGLARRETDDTA